MTKLTLIDASWVIYCGSNSDGYKWKTYCGFPCGGFAYLLQKVNQSYVTDNKLVVCFDSHTDRSKILTDYKSQRVYNHVVAGQIKHAYRALQECGVSCAMVDGYEADDLIASFCDLYGGVYDIEIISNDMDLAHSVVGNTKLLAFTTDGTDINSTNFSKHFGKKGIVSNSITVWKIYHGDKSDNIKPLTNASEQYRDFIQWCKDTTGATDDEETWDVVADSGWSFNMMIRSLDMFKYYAGFMPNSKELLDRASVFFPRPLNVSDIMVTGQDDLDVTVASYYYKMMDNHHALRMIGAREVVVPRHYVDNFTKLGTEFKSGAMSADLDAPIHELNVFGESLIDERGWF